MFGFVCLSVHLFVRPHVITLGCVLCIILLLCKWVETFVTFGKIDYLKESHKYSHLCINSYLYLYIYACIKSLLTYVSDIDSYRVGFFIVLRSYVCWILDLYQFLMYYVVYTDF